MKVRVVVAALLVLVLVAAAAGLVAAQVLGSGGDDGSAPKEPRPDPSGLPAAPTGLERFYDQQPEWSGCKAGFECADVEVPLDYADPAGETLQIKVNRRDANEMDSWQGALLVNPGGPGASGKDYARSVDNQLGSILDSYDLVGFDPRGAGQSAPVDCLSDAELDTFVGSEQTPDDAAERKEYADAIADVGAGCVEKSGDLAGHISTVEAARDMDIIRQVVGDKVMHYFGSSYGTKLGATYAELFPERVGRMVLDGAVDPTLDSVESGYGQLGGFETALQSYLAYCVDEGDCPLGDSTEEASVALADLMEGLDDDPLGGGGDRAVAGGWAFYGLALPLYAEEIWPVLTQALQAAVDGDGSGLLQLADLYTSRGKDGYANNMMEALLAINCGDDPADRSMAEVQKDLPRFEQRSAVFGAVFGWSTVGCVDWPVQPSEPAPKIDAAGADPILVVGTTRDPATPYEWAVALASQLESGVLLTRDGDGHGAFAHGNECIDDTISSYLVDGAVPKAGKRC
ncbi:MAG: alpha/beta fold hydrolase [Propionibacteriales bacterium]|nr:alpha/beta fold hydrolase [Propionibacteriales bacterium]